MLRMSTSGIATTAQCYTQYEQCVTTLICIEIYIYLLVQRIFSCRRFKGCTKMSSFLDILRYPYLTVRSACQLTFLYVRPITDLRPFQTLRTHKMDHAGSIAVNPPHWGTTYRRIRSPFSVSALS